MRLTGSLNGMGINVKNITLSITSAALLLLSTAAIAAPVDISYQSAGTSTSLETKKNGSVNAGLNAITVDGTNSLAVNTSNSSMAGTWEATVNNYAAVQAGAGKYNSGRKGKEKYAKAIDSAVFPGNQGGPLMHVIAAKATCFQEAGKPEFITYQKQVKSNSHAMANALTGFGFHVVSGGTDNHLLLLDLRPSHPEMTGKVAQLALEGGNLTLNRNTVPGETRSPFQTSGLRIGTPAVTSRGMREAEMEIIAGIVYKILQAPDEASTIESQRQKSLALCSRFPLPY